VRSRLVLAHGVQGAGDRDVAEVVAGGGGERAVLAPAGHPAVDQPRVASQAVVRAEAEPLRRTGPETFDQHVGGGHQVEDGGDRVGVLEVERDARPAAVEQVGGAAGERLATRPVDADHVGAEVGQDHARMRTRPDAGQLHDLHPTQRAGPLAELEAHGPDPLSPP
jgi:hypothetical protein